MYQKYERLMSGLSDGRTRKLTNHISVEDVVLSVDTSKLLWDPGPHLDQFCPVAGVAEEMVPQGVTPLVWLVSQLHLALLAHVAVHVEVLLHGHHPHRLLGPLHRRDSLPTRSTFRGEDTMEVIDTVNFVVKVDSEGDAVQTIVADAAAEAARVVGFADGLEDALHDEVAADLALLRGLLEAGVEVVLLAVNLPVHVVERLAAESAATAAAHEAVGVVQVTHGLQTWDYFKY